MRQSRRQSRQAVRAMAPKFACRRHRRAGNRCGRQTIMFGSKQHQQKFEDTGCQPSRHLGEGFP